jgi:hypothetical protein
MSGECLAQAKRAEENAERAMADSETASPETAGLYAKQAHVWAMLAVAARVGDVSESLEAIWADGVGVG